MISSFPSFRIVSGGRGKRPMLEKLNREEVVMTEQSTPPATATAPPPAPEVAAAIEGALSSYDRKLWHVRHAAVCCLVDLAMAHGKKKFKSDATSRAITDIIDIVERIVAPDDAEEIPNGFGEPARAAGAKALQEAIAEVKAIRAPLEQSVTAAAGALRNGAEDTP